jgi:excisionase family DNA binding protein
LSARLGDAEDIMVGIPIQAITAARVRYGLEADAYSPQDICRILGLDRSTVHRLTKSGKLRATRAGQQLRIMSADLAEFILANQVAVTPLEERPEPNQTPAGRHRTSRARSRGRPRTGVIHRLGDKDGKPSGGVS